MIEQQPNNQPAQNQTSSEQVKNPEELTHAERIKHISFLAADVKRHRQEYIARAINTKRAA